MLKLIKLSKSPHLSFSHDGTGRRLSAVLLFLLSTALPGIAMADNWNGVRGAIFVFCSIPVAILGFFISLAFIMKGAFRKTTFFCIHSAVYISAASAVVIASAAGGDHQSLSIALIGESIFLLIVLLPGFIQYLGRNRYNKDHANKSPE
ncbi:hypothetical protein ACO0LC_11015 [Undibacterium sp. JH2W]|uniref:hypothetical protein n=1 Tax=Undibacterium sp. JH2W TaxID=3413037 RepID=UPI003BF430E3